MLQVLKIKTKTGGIIINYQVKLTRGLKASGYAPLTLHRSKYDIVKVLTSSHKS